MLYKRLGTVAGNGSATYAVHAATAVLTATLLKHIFFYFAFVKFL